MIDTEMKTATTSTSIAAGAHKPWVERYRPKSLQDVSHQSEVVATLENAVVTGRLPHCLFYGPPGSGKTSVALALCRQLWAPSQWNRRVLELNASDERGISVVRDKIKHFASLSVGTASTSSNSKKRNFFGTPAAAAAAGATADGTAAEEKKYPNPPFKIIILDEADTVTPDAQAALRRIIEANSRITRFILICNYVTRIIEPLASRCAKFRFQPLPPASMKARLTQIATQEQCTEAEMALVDDILEQADGDMRRAVTTLQSVHSLAAGGGDANIIVDRDTLAEIAGLPPPSVVNVLWNEALQQQKSFDGMREAVQELCLEGYAAKFLLLGLLPKVTESTILSERHKAELAIRMAEAEKNMVEGADEFLQLLTVCSLAFTCLQQANAASN